MRLSATVSSVSRLSSWGTTPRRLLISGPSVAGSRPSTRRCPSDTGETAPTMRMVEVLPAPLGPRNPNASPRATLKSMPSTATRSPKRLVTPLPSTSGSIGGKLPGMDVREQRFREVFERCYAPLTAYARRRVPPSDADDVVAEALTVAWRRLDDVPEGDGALPWMYAVASRVVANHHRSLGRR